MDNSPPREFPSHPLPRTDVNRNNNNNNGAHDSGQDHPRVRFAEGGPQTIFQPTPRRDRPPTTTTDSTGQPAVYWDDRDNDPNTSGYTFYREGTPTPPEYGSHEKGLGHGRGLAGPAGEGSTAGAGAFGSEADINQWNLPPGTQSNRPLWGMERKRLIAIVILVLICVAIGLGVGLGVGLSRGKTTGVESVPVPASTLSLASAVNPAPTTTDPPTATPAGTNGASGTTTGSAANPRPTYNSDCPSLNNTIYHVPGSTRSFLRVCGVDYSGGGATDIGQIATGSMADCMAACASFDQCTACSWGYIDGDEGDKHRCYFKKNLQTKHVAEKDWCFAILQ